MKKFIQILTAALCASSAGAALGTTVDDLDFSRQIMHADFAAVPVTDTSYAFVWARKVKASYELRSAGSGGLLQTLTVVFKPGYDRDVRDDVLADAGLQDRGPLEAFQYFRKDEIKCGFSDEMLRYLADHMSPAPRVTTTVGGYPNLCTLSVRVPTSTKEDIEALFQDNKALSFSARPVLCKKESPKLPIRDLLAPLEAKRVGQTLATGEWQGNYLNLVYESVSLTLNPDSVFGKNGGRSLWEKFMTPFTLDTTQKLATLSADALRSTVKLCYEMPLEVSYGGVESAAR